MPDYTPTVWVDDDGSGTTGTVYTATRMNNIEGQLDLVSDMFVAFKATLATDAVLPAAPTFEAGVFTASANVALTIDSASAASGDIVLVKDETRPERNGLYVVNNAGGAGAKYILHRIAAQDSEAEIIAAEIVSIEKGLANGDSVWRLASEGKLNPNKTPQEFSRIVPSGSVMNVRLATVGALPGNGRVGNTLTANANGALTVDGVTVAVDDLILVIEETPSKHNGIYSVTATGAAGAKWVLDRATGFKANQDIVAGAITVVSEGTRNSDRQYALTTDAPITLNTTALVFSRPIPKDFGIVEILPTSKALKGDRCVFRVGIGIYWQCLYTEEVTYPWAVIGGPPMRQQKLSEGTVTEAYKTENAPSLTLPEVAMDFDIRYGATLGFSTGEFNEAIMTPFVNAVEQEDRLKVFLASQGVPVHHDTLGLTAAAGQVVQIKYKAAKVTGLATFRQMYLEVMPKRIG